MLDYDLLKHLAKRVGRPVKDLITLAPANDPFYAGCPHRERDARWFEEIWDSFGFIHETHLRRIHYQVISVDAKPILKPDGQPYQNTQNDWALLARAGLAARYLDLVPADAFVDRRNDEPMIFAADPLGEPSIGVYDYETDISWNLPDFPDLPNFIVRNFEAEQDYLVEVWIEKSTQNDWLVPLCRARKANLVVGIGELSEVACRQLVQRVERSGKPARILYLSDFDPGGRSMPVAVARKVEFYITKWDLDADVTLQPVILTEDQCFKYKLPRTPIKETERRKDTFEDKFGQGATELDALEALYPGTGREIVDAEISRYIDKDLEYRVREVHLKLRRRFNDIESKVRAPYAEAIRNLEDRYEDLVARFEAWGTEADSIWSEIADQLHELKPDIAKYPKPRACSAEETEAMFDSKRDHLTQLEHYHDWQRRE